MLSFHNTQTFFVDKGGVAYGLPSLLCGPGTDGGAPRQVGADTQDRRHTFLAAQLQCNELPEIPVILVKSLGTFLTEDGTDAPADLEMTLKSAPAGFDSQRIITLRPSHFAPLAYWTLVEEPVWTKGVWRDDTAEVLPSWRS
jgi:hypothetical protein